MIAEQDAAMERAADELLHAMHAAAELGHVIGPGHLGPVSIPYPFPTPQDPHKNLAFRPQRGGCRPTMAAIPSSPAKLHESMGGPAAPDAAE